MSDTRDRQPPLMLTRSEFVRLGAAAAAARFVVGSGSTGAARADDGGPGAAPAALPQHPDLLILVTDQTREFMHWPDNWVETYLPNELRLVAKGLTFRRCFANAAMCSPSRATLFTGLYPTQHGVQRTLTYGGSRSGEEVPLSASLPNLAKMLAATGYHVVLKGKWHLSKHADGNPPDATDVAAFGFQEWVPTTAGEGLELSDFGGGCADNDSDTITQAIQFLESQKVPGRTTPFCLVVSLANPHDVLSYPRTWDSVDPDTGCDNYAQTAQFNLGIGLPPSYDSDNLSLKPTAQAQSLDLYAAGLGILTTPQRRHDYVNFLGYLHHLVDMQIGQLLDALGTLTSNTVILRTSDHGEMGLAHGGLRQKMFNCYEETMRIRMVVSNPQLFPDPVSTDALAALVDVLPTVAAIAHVAPANVPFHAGVDLTPLFTDPAATIQNVVIFTFDDSQAGTANGQTTVTQPNHIRAIRVDDDFGQWKYGRYFDPAGVAADQIEMYHLVDSAGAPVDPEELDNLGNPGSPNYVAYQTHRDRLAALLAAVELDPLGVIHRDGFEGGATTAWNGGVRP